MARMLSEARLAEIEARRDRCWTLLHAPENSYGRGDDPGLCELIAEDVPALIAALRAERRARAERPRGESHG